MFKVKYLAKGRMTVAVDSVCSLSRRAFSIEARLLETRQAVSLPSNPIRDPIFEEAQDLLSRFAVSKHKLL